MKKIAFCFLIYDVINHEELWNIFFKNINILKYNIYIHYKNDIKLKYFENFKLKKCIETRWGDISLVYSQNLLLTEALNDINNEHFIFLSNSCIPLKSFNYIYTYLNTSYSYFTMNDESEIFPRCDLLLNYFDKSLIKKAHQWCILNKIHATIILNNLNINLFSNISAPDEHFYITNIYINNLQNNIITLNHVPTFTNWITNFSSPKTYDNITKEELINLLNSESLFARKFSSNCSINLFNQIYLNKILSK